MRMWNVDPRLMCRQHLLGEHVEMHMAVGSIRKGISLQGYIDTALMEPHRIVARHDQLVKEMIRRGYNHQSPLKLPRQPQAGSVDSVANLKELGRRCVECRKLIKEKERV